MQTTWNLLKSEWQGVWEWSLIPDHGQPCQILMKFAPVVGFGLKVTHEDSDGLFWLRNPLIMHWIGWNLSFFKEHVSGRSAEQELFRICLKAPKRPKFRERSARVKIISLRPHIRNPHYRVCPRDVPYNAGFLYEHVEKWFWHEPNACKISYKRVDFCSSVTLMSRETAVQSSIFGGYYNNFAMLWVTANLRPLLL